MILQGIMELVVADIEAIDEASVMFEEAMGEASG